MSRLRAADVIRFRKAVYDYYGEHGRSDLPWRNARDPYRILVSEFMLQQTQVPRVVEKYEPFMERFPDFAALARAPLRDLLAAWSGLGYNRRALYLKRTAERIVTEFGGTLPSNADALATLPGIGAATAGAIAAFAFGAAHSFIETNIRAVYIHHFFRDHNDVTDGEILPLIEQTLDRNDPRGWYNALMDYGVMLKKMHRNPSRRSAHYAKQGAFEGSDRQARGYIIRALTKRDLGERLLLRETGLDPTRLRKNVDALIDEGLVVGVRRRYSLG